MVCNTRLAKHEVQGPSLCHILSSRMHNVNITTQTKLSYASTENSLILFNKSDSVVVVYFLCLISGLWCNHQ